MKPIKFEGANINLAENQPEYRAMWIRQFTNGLVLSKWEFTDEEIEEINRTRCYYHGQYTFNRPPQPILPAVFKGEILNQAEIDNLKRGLKHIAASIDSVKSQATYAGYVQECERVGEPAQPPEDYALMKQSELDNLRRTLEAIRSDIQFIRENQNE